jgi:hypothetical protein
VTLYFDPVTKQIWNEGPDDESGSQMDIDERQLRGEALGGSVPTSRVSPVDFGDDEINAAARLVSMVSRCTFQCSESAVDDLRFQSDGFETFENLATPTAPAPNHLDPSGSHQFQGVIESDTESQPRLSAADKGKQPININSRILASEDEPISDEDGMFRGSVTPVPYTATGVILFSDR